jgi:hypothetical protein
MAQSVGSPGWVPLPENRHIQLLKHHSLKNQMMDKVRKNIVSVNLNHSLFSLFDMFTQKWDQWVVPKGWYIIITMHCIMSQNSADLT